MKNASIAKCSVIAALMVAACSSSPESTSSEQSALGPGGSGGTTGSGGVMSPTDPSLTCSDDMPFTQYTSGTVEGASCNSQFEWKLYADGVNILGVTCDAAAKDDPMPAETDALALGQWWVKHSCNVQSVDIPQSPDPCASAGYVSADATGILINRCVDAVPGCGNIYDAARDWVWLTSPSWYGQRQHDGTFVMNAPDTFAADCNADYSCCDFYDVPAGMAPSEIHACDRFLSSGSGGSPSGFSAGGGGGLNPAPPSGAPNAQATIHFMAEPANANDRTPTGERLGHATIGTGYALLLAGALMGAPQVSQMGQKLVDAGTKVTDVYEKRREQRRKLEAERLPGQPAVVGPPDPTEGEVRRYLELVTSRTARQQEIEDARRALERDTITRPAPRGERPRPVDADPGLPGSDPRRLPDRPRPRPRGR